MGMERTLSERKEIWMAISNNGLLKYLGQGDGKKSHLRRKSEQVVREADCLSVTRKHRFTALVLDLSASGNHEQDSKSCANSGELGCEHTTQHMVICHTVTSLNEQSRKPRCS